MRPWLGNLLTVVVVLALLKVLVWFLEPRMAFFPWRGVQETPAAAGIQYSDHSIRTADGETLHGWWMEHPSARAQIIYWHGNGGNLSLWSDVLIDLQRRGFSVFAVDYRGYGASTGSPSEKGIYRDGDAATTYFTEKLRKPGVPVVFWGRSLGCSVASYMAAKSAPDGLVLESPFPDVASVFAGNPVMRVLSVFSNYTFATARHLEAYTGPLLVLHGDADSIIPFAAGRRVYDRAPTTRKTFVVLTGFDHNDRHTSHRAYWHAIDRFAAALATP